MKTHSSRSSLTQIQNYNGQQLVLPLETSFKKKKRSQLVWKIQENQIYVQFLKVNKQLFNTQANRRSYKIYDKLSKLLLQRTADQCRTHHKKMMLSYKTINRIVKYVQGKIKKHNLKCKKQFITDSNIKRQVKQESKQKQENELLYNESINIFMNKQQEEEGNEYWQMINNGFWISE